MGGTHGRDTSFMDALLVEVFQHPLLWHIRCRRGASTPSDTLELHRKINQPQSDRIRSKRMAEMFGERFDA